MLECKDFAPTPELQKVQENSILNTLQQQKLRWIGQILRQESLLPDILKGSMLGKATRERERKWLQMLSDVTSKTCEDLKRRTGVGSIRDCQKPAIKAEDHREKRYDLNSVTIYSSGSAGCSKVYNKSSEFVEVVLFYRLKAFPDTPVNSATAKTLKAMYVHNANSKT